MPKHGDSIWKRKDGRWEARYIRDRDATAQALYSEQSLILCKSQIPLQNDDIIQLIFVG